MEEKNLESFLNMFTPVEFVYLKRSGLAKNIGKPLVEINKAEESDICKSSEKSLAIDLGNGSAMEIFTMKAFPLIKDTKYVSLSVKVGSKESRVALDKVRDNKSSLIALLNALKNYNMKSEEVLALYERIKSEADFEFKKFLSSLYNASINIPSSTCFRFKSDSASIVDKIRSNLKEGSYDCDCEGFGNVIVRQTDISRNLAAEIRTGYELPFLGGRTYNPFDYYKKNINTFYHINSKATLEDLETYLNRDVKDIKQVIESSVQATLLNARRAGNEDIEVISEYVGRIISQAADLQMKMKRKEPWEK